MVEWDIVEMNDLVDTGHLQNCFLSWGGPVVVVGGRYGIDTK